VIVISPVKFCPFTEAVVRISLVSSLYFSNSRCCWRQRITSIDIFRVQIIPRATILINPRKTIIVIYNVIIIGNSWDTRGWRKFLFLLRLLSCWSFSPMSNVEDADTYYNDDDKYCRNCRVYYYLPWRKIFKW